MMVVNVSVRLQPEDDAWDVSGASSSSICG